MKRIYKYHLDPDRTYITLPKASVILSTLGQGNNIVLYALVNIDEKVTEDVYYRIYGTGHNIDVDVINDFKYLNTITLYDASLVFHIYIKGTR